MENNRHALVSIGVPVYNGEAGLARTLDGLLCQDYPHLEIILSDNGSTDATPQIAARYAAGDARVKYHRAERNNGITWNFNRVFELSSGEYFMWAAHDDERRPSFVSACLNRLEECPGAVLCQAHTAMFIEGHSEVLCVAHLDTFEGVSGPVARYRETLKRFPATAFYGLYRASGIRKTRMFQKSIATDVAFVQELSIHGDFVQVPQVLFNYFGREKWNTVDQDYRAIFGKPVKPFWYLPFVALFYSHWTRIAASPIPSGTKLRLWLVLIRYQLEQTVLKLAVKITGATCPDRWKERVGVSIYSRWMHTANVEVGSSDLFLERVIKPTLGWWRTS